MLSRILVHHHLPSLPNHTLSFVVSCWWFRNAAPVEVGTCSLCIPWLTMFYLHPRWCRISSINSTSPQSDHKENTSPWQNFYQLEPEGDCCNDMFLFPVCFFAVRYPYWSSSIWQDSVILERTKNIMITLSQVSFFSIFFDILLHRRSHIRNHQTLTLNPLKVISVIIPYTITKVVNGEFIDPPNLRYFQAWSLPWK